MLSTLSHVIIDFTIYNRFNISQTDTPHPCLESCKRDLRKMKSAHAKRHGSSALSNTLEALLHKSQSSVDEGEEQLSDARAQFLGYVLGHQSVQAGKGLARHLDVMLEAYLELRKLSA